ncbi:MAG: ABC transporter permease subunit [bacterium]|nr:ABC transporter permease subunit [bacterium]
MASSSTSRRQRARRSLIFAVFLVALALLYTGYKAVGQAIDDTQRDWWVVGSFLPRSDDKNMPPVLDILAEFGKAPREGGTTIGKLTFDGALFTLREAAVGFGAGTIIGLAIAVVLLQSRRAERGVLPYVIASQTVPLIAIAPIVVVWGRTNFGFLPWEWEDWMSVSLIATYLTFFPVAVNGLRGLQSPSPEATELMQSYAAGRRQVLRRLQLPASLPFLFPAFRIAATASVVGAIVGEISAGVRGGLGRLILDFAGKYITGPERLYVAVIGACITGLVAVGAVALAERLVLARRGELAR